MGVRTSRSGLPQGACGWLLRKCVDVMDMQACQWDSLPDHAIMGAVRRRQPERSQRMSLIAIIAMSRFVKESRRRNHRIVCADAFTDGEAGTILRCIVACLAMLVASVAGALLAEQAGIAWLSIALGLVAAVIILAALLGIVIAPIALFFHGV